MQNREESLRQVWQALRAGKKFFIAGHLNPDGDSLGCTLTMTSLLERLGKTVYAYCAPAVGNDLKFLPGIPKIHVGVLPEKPDFFRFLTVIFHRHPQISLKVFFPACQEPALADVSKRAFPVSWLRQ